MNGNKKSKILIIVILLLISLLAVAVIIILGNSEGAETENGTGTIFNIGVDKDAQSGKTEVRSKEDIVEELNKKVEENMINISMNMSPVFKDGLSEGDLYIYNEEINNYIQVVEIYLEDTEELIYTSGGIPVGSRVDYAKLDKALVKGEYNCIAYFNALNSETGALIGKAGAQIRITVQN